MCAESLEQLARHSADRRQGAESRAMSSRDDAEDYRQLFEATRPRVVRSRLVRRSRRGGRPGDRPGGVPRTVPALAEACARTSGPTCAVRSDGASAQRSGGRADAAARPCWSGRAEPAARSDPQPGSDARRIGTPVPDADGTADRHEGVDQPRAARRLLAAVRPHRASTPSGGCRLPCAGRHRGRDAWPRREEDGDRRPRPRPADLRRRACRPTADRRPRATA